jgi:hypothetical protein
MKSRDIIYLSVVGLVIWIIGTVYYGYIGSRVLETTSLSYWISFALSPVFSALICIAILRRRHIPSPNWAAAMLLLAIPGMIGEALVLTNLTTFMPRLHAESGGRYGALLFATYAMVLGIAEIVTLRATR